ncbi:MAG: heme-dependent oxidative N-demethylase family protein [Acidimicrobiales bacterium]
MSEPIDYVPLDERGFRLAMGLRPLDVARWLEVDDHREAELSLKSDLLATRRDVVVATRPAGDAASAELLDEVVAWLAEHHPDLARDVDAGEHPVVAASRLVQEDLCVLVKSDAWRLEAACVCFPSRWRLATKIGTTLDEIHSPVPGYDDELARPTTSVFDRLRPERSFWRLNWTLLDHPDLHQPEAARVSAATDLDAWWFRVERQTIRALARSGAVVFTIRTYVTPLAEMVARHDDLAANLLRALDDAPEATRAYKGWVGVARRLRDATGV